MKGNSDKHDGRNLTPTLPALPSWPVPRDTSSSSITNPEAAPHPRPLSYLYGGAAACHFSPPVMVWRKYAEGKIVSGAEVC